MIVSEILFGQEQALLKDIAARFFREKWPIEAVREQLETAASGGQINLNLELVYGHCWGSGARSSGGEFRVDANAIPFRRDT